jgi:ABC-type transport system substrate-binding protein
MHGFTPAGMPPYSTAVPVYHYDLAKARKLLAEAGYPHGGFTIHAIWATGFTAHSIFEQILQASLAKLGVHMTVQAVPIPTWTSTGQDPKRNELWDNEWTAAVADPSDYLTGMFSCATVGVTNWNYYCNHKLDHLVQEGIVAKSMAQRARYYAQANDILMHDVPMIPIFQADWITPMNSAVKGYICNPLNQITYNLYDMHK